MSRAALPDVACATNDLTMADLSARIEEAAADPKRMTTDAGSVEEHDLGQLIEADKYLQQQAAAKAPHRRLRYGKYIPPGTT